MRSWHGEKLFRLVVSIALEQPEDVPVVHGVIAQRLEDRRDFGRYWKTYTIRPEMFFYICRGNDIMLYFKINLFTLTLSFSHFFLVVLCVCRTLRRLLPRRQTRSYLPGSFPSFQIAKNESIRKAITFQLTSIGFEFVTARRHFRKIVGDVDIHSWTVLHKRCLDIGERVRFDILMEKRMNGCTLMWKVLCSGRHGYTLNQQPCRTSRLYLNVLREYLKRRGTLKPITTLILLVYIFRSYAQAVMAARLVNSHGRSSHLYPNVLCEYLERRDLSQNVFLLFSMEPQAGCSRDTQSLLHSGMFRAGKNAGRRAVYASMDAQKKAPLLHIRRIEYIQQTGQHKYIVAYHTNTRCQDIYSTTISSDDTLPSYSSNVNAHNESCAPKSSKTRQSREIRFMDTPCIARGKN